MAAHDVQIQIVESVPLAVVRRQARQAELASLVPACCGLVWEAVRSQRVKAGRHVALYWDGSIRLEVGVELHGPFTDDGEVVASATPAGTVAMTTHLGPYAGLGAAHDAIARWCAGQRPPPRRAVLGDLRPLAARVGHQPRGDLHRRLLPARDQLDSPPTAVRSSATRTCQRPSAERWNQSANGRTSFSSSPWKRQCACWTPVTSATPSPRSISRFVQRHREHLRRNRADRLDEGGARRRRAARRPQPEVRREERIDGVGVLAPDRLGERGRRLGDAGPFVHVAAVLSRERPGTSAGHGPGRGARSHLTK